MELDELKGLPIVKAHMTQIDFELTDENIEKYRDTFDDSTVTLVYWEEEDSFVEIGSDMCDALYTILSETEDREFTINNIYYIDHYEVKNYDGDEMNLIGAAVEAYASPEDRCADEVGENVVVELIQNEEPVCFVMSEYNAYDEEITEKDFNSLWNS